MADIDREALAEGSQKLMRMIEYIAEEECKDQGMPTNIMTSVYMNLCEDAFQEGLKNIANKGGLDQALTFIQLCMSHVQHFVKMAKSVEEQLLKMKQNEQQKR